MCQNTSRISDSNIVNMKDGHLGTGRTAAADLRQEAKEGGLCFFHERGDAGEDVRTTKLADECRNRRSDPQRKARFAFSEQNAAKF